MACHIIGHFSTRKYFLWLCVKEPRSKKRKKNLFISHMWEKNHVRTNVYGKDWSYAWLYSKVFNHGWEPWVAAKKHFIVAETDESAGKIIEKDNGWRKTDWNREGRWWLWMRREICSGSWETVKQSQAAPAQQWGVMTSLDGEMGRLLTDRPDRRWELERWVDKWALEVDK